jgi:peptide/nickel transport system substrate-binding protein
VTAITWEDGKPITSKDIKYGIERVWAQDVAVRRPDLPDRVLDPRARVQGPVQGQVPDKLGLKAIETPDDKTIVFHLPKPNSDFPTCSRCPASPVRQDKDTGRKYG